MNFAQRVLVEFRHDKTSISGKAATGDAGRFYDFFNTGGKNLFQLGIGAVFPHAAIDVQGDWAGFFLNHQARKQGVVGEFMKIIKLEHQAEYPSWFNDIIIVNKNPINYITT